MKDLRVDSVAVLTAADKISTINKAIYDKIGDVEVSVTKLNSTWDSPSAAGVIGKFFAIKETYSTSRYDVVENYIRFLHNQVGDGYTTAEELNKTLAEAFK